MLTNVNIFNVYNFNVANIEKGSMFVSILSSTDRLTTMRTFNVPTRSDVSAESAAIFDNIEKGLGRLPNLYATIGYSANTLGAYLAFQGAMAKSVFSLKEREAVFLIVSQTNNCEYCLGVHTAILGMNKVDEAETINIRKGEATDPKVRTITRLAAEISANRGRVSEEALEAFFALGYTNEGLIDLIALVGDKTIANLVHNVTKVTVDWPATQPVEVSFELAA
jgi:AhpD family alkylhydroperoxidase